MGWHGSSMTGSLFERVGFRPCRLTPGWLCGRSRATIAAAGSCAERAYRRSDAMDKHNGRHVLKR
jgi:hypothetical protein